MKIFDIVILLETFHVVGICINVKKLSVQVYLYTLEKRWNKVQSTKIVCFLEREQ